MLPVLLASETFEESWSVAVWTDSPRASGAPVLVRSGHPRGEERPFSLGAALGGFLGVGLSSCLPGGLPPCLGNLFRQSSRVRQGNCRRKALASGDRGCCLKNRSQRCQKVTLAKADGMKSYLF